MVNSNVAIRLTEERRLDFNRRILDSVMQDLGDIMRSRVSSINANSAKDVGYDLEWSIKTADQAVFQGAQLSSSTDGGMPFGVISPFIATMSSVYSSDGLDFTRENIVQENKTTVRQAKFTEEQEEAFTALNSVDNINKDINGLVFADLDSKVPRPRLNSLLAFKPISGNTGVTEEYSVISNTLNDMGYRTELVQGSQALVTNAGEMTYSGFTEFVSTVQEELGDMPVNVLLSSADKREGMISNLSS